MTTTTTTHSSAPMIWPDALRAWLAAARAPQAGAPVLDDGVLDGAVGPDDLVARAQEMADLYLRDQQEFAAVAGGHVWGASVPRVEDDAIVWGRGASRCVLAVYGDGAWVVEVECDGDPYACAALQRADAARYAGATWARIRPDVRPAARAARDLAAAITPA